MSWIALGVTVATTAGTAIYNSSQQKKAAKKAQAGAAGTGGINFGEKPDVAEYVPVNFNAEQLAGVGGNRAALPEIQQLMGRTNATIDADALSRIRKMMPGYNEMLRLEGDATTDLLGGRLPYEDVLDIVANRGELTGAMGVPGTGGNATLRDLGLSRLDAIKSGQGMMQNMVQMAETINPVGRRMRPQDMFLSPLDRIRASMEQNQLIQQSTQNKYNIDAGLSPTDQAGAQLQLARMLSGGGGGSGAGGIDWGSIISSVGGAAAGAIGSYSSGVGTAPTYTGSFATNPVPGVTNQIYRPAGGVDPVTGKYRPSSAYSVPAI